MMQDLGMSLILSTYNFKNAKCACELELKSTSLYTQQGIYLFLI